MSSTIADFVGGSPVGRDDEPPFKEGRPSEHPVGVLYQGPWAEPADGFNEHVRRCAKALATTGCPVHLRGFGPHAFLGAPKEFPTDIASLLTASIGSYSVSVHQLVASKSTTFGSVITHRHLTPEQLAHFNRFKVISTVLERDRVQADVVKAFNCVGQVWVGCQLSAEVLRSSGVDESRIRVVPVPYFLDDPLLSLRRRLRRPGPVRFYHIGKWEPRKAQENILLAFLRAFRPGEAQFTLKCTPLRTKTDGYPVGPVEAIQMYLKEDAQTIANGWTADKANVFIDIVTNRLSDEAIVALHRFGDVYVTLSRGEGFDMPAFDAKIAGNLMIYTPSGGPRDFADTDNDIRIESTGSIVCHPFYQDMGWPRDARYLDYNVDEAMRAMRLARIKIRQCDRSIKNMESFEASQVGHRMLSYLRELVGQDGKVF